MALLGQLLKQIANPADVAWSDETYDLAMARNLSAEDRATLVARLLEAIRVDGDARAVMTLAHMGAADALPTLQYLAITQNPIASTARRAMVLLGHGADVVAAIAEDAVHSPLKMTRVAAVMDLAKLHGPVALGGLVQALGDVDYAVRVLAWDGLVEALDLLPLILNPEGKRELETEIELYRVFLASDLPELVKLGIAEMRALVGKLDTGETPASLGIAWRANPAPETFAQLRTAQFDEDAAFPVDAIAQLDGAPRRWAEAMIAMRLEERDIRVPDALARLDAQWTLPVLASVAETAPSELRAALERAIATLRAS